MVRRLSRLLKWIDTLNHMMTPIKTKITRNKAATSWINKFSRNSGNHFIRFDGPLFSTLTKKNTIGTIVYNKFLVKKEDEFTVKHSNQPTESFSVMIIR